MKNNTLYDWAVIGGGAAGIAAVGKLIDAQVPKKSILWLDSDFSGGDLARFWSNIPSNTTVGRFVDYFKNCQAFKVDEIAAKYQLFKLPLEQTCRLELVAQVLQIVTKQLREQVATNACWVRQIALQNNLWTIQSDTNSFKAKQVIMSPGALPKSLSYPWLPEISLAQALNPTMLETRVEADGHYAVFGSSHSAILILKNLIEIGVRKVTNIYRQPCCYALNMGDWILFDDNGLKGEAARWARQHIDGHTHANLKRILYNSQTIQSDTSSCDAAIYAVGFEKRSDIRVEGYPDVSYNPVNGIIAPGLFGFGIAYPQRYQDKFGHESYRVGMWKFMDYLNQILPMWLRYSA